MSASALKQLPTLLDIQLERERRRATSSAGDQRASNDNIAESVQACKSLAQFVREAWHVLEPDQPLVWNWHLDALCAHLEAITFDTFLKMGLLNRLLANVPPGSSKSLIVSVMWNAWEWSLGGKFLSKRYLVTSYNGDPVQRDTMKCRDLILSDWYQARFPHVKLVVKGDTHLMNSGTGTRRGSAFGSLTSKRADRFILDDPHSTETAESDTERKSTTRKFREGAINRLNDQAVSAIVVIMQRLHAQDISGVIAKVFGIWKPANDNGEASARGSYIHLMLPMEFEPERACVTPIFKDPRTKLNELLDKQRFPEEVLTELRKMGAYVWAGQYQQRPSPREGGLFKREWFVDKMRRVAPMGTRWVRGWDLGGGEDKKSDPTAGVKLGLAPDKSWWIAHSAVTRGEGNAVRLFVKSTAQTDTVAVHQDLPQDPGQAGKVQAKDYVSWLAGFIVRTSPEFNDKETRAEPFSVQLEAGNVYYLEGEWNEAYIDELCNFPGGSDHDDQVDATSRAFARLLLGGGGVVTVMPLLVTAGRTGLGDHPEVLNR